MGRTLQKKYFGKLASILCESYQVKLLDAYNLIFDFYHEDKFEYVLEIDLHNLNLEIKKPQEETMKIYQGQLQDFRAYFWYDHFVFGFIPVAKRIKYIRITKNSGRLEAL